MCLWYHKIWGEAKEITRKQCLPHKVLTNISYGAANQLHHRKWTLNPINILKSCWRHKKMIIISMSLWYIISFMPFLNFSIREYSSYPLPLAACLNSWTNSSIVFPSYSNLLNSATLTVSSSPLLNFFLNSVRNFFTISYSRFYSSKSSKMFSFWTSADPFCI